MAEMPFNYEDLPSQHSIRLLELRPGTEGDTITCSLTTHLLRPAPTYDALSYTWGSSEVAEVLPLMTSHSMFASMHTISFVGSVIDRKPAFSGLMLSALIKAI